MVEVHNNGGYNNKLLKLWICDCICTFDGKQVPLPNIVYEPINPSNFGWIKFMEMKNLELPNLYEREVFSP